MTDNMPMVDRRTGETVDLSSPGGMRRIINAQQADINALLDDVRDLADAVAGLATQLENQGRGGLASGTTPWCWRDLSSEAAEALWTELTEWVKWLRGRYPVAEQLPACWPEHSELVEELTALYAAWKATYRNPEAHPTAPVEFHDRWLPGFLSRVKAWGVYCEAEHRDRSTGTYASQR